MPLLQVHPSRCQHVFVAKAWSAHQRCKFCHAPKPKDPERQRRSHEAELRRKQRLEEEAREPKPSPRDVIREALVCNWDGDVPDFDDLTEAIATKLAENGLILDLD